MSKENLLTEADPQEVSQAEQEAAQSAGVYVHTFQPPFSWKKPYIFHQNPGGRSPFSPLFPKFFGIFSCILSRKGFDTR